MRPILYGRPSSSSRFLFGFAQTHKRNAKADQVKNNAVAVLSQGARLSVTLGRTIDLLAQSKQSELERARSVVVIQEPHIRSE